MRNFPLLNNNTSKKQNLLKYFLDTYELYESLFELLKNDSVFYKAPEKFRHPLIFYFGHTATFFINKLILGKVINKRVDKNFESIFAIGVDEMKWDDLDKSRYKWPDVNQIREYRNKVKQVVINVINNFEDNFKIEWDEDAWIILMGIEHEKIHLETSSVLIRQLDIEDIIINSNWKICDIAGLPPHNSFVNIKGGLVSLGKTKDHKFYGWDNEYGKKDTEVKNFQASKYLVSNNEFMNFVNDDGYKKFEYWSDEGKVWLKENKSTSPLFWIPYKDTYKYRTVCSIIDIPLNWPVEVNFLEAKAFCNWKSSIDNANYRMPNEEEYFQMCKMNSLVEDDDFETKKANINLEQYFSPCPVDKNQFNDLYDLIGNVWQWNESCIDSFEGFKTHKVYDDFSTPTFDKNHNLIKGGSWISTGNETSKYSRYAFRKHFYQHAGFRYIQSKTPIKDENTYYESDTLLGQYYEMHYGGKYFNTDNFSKTLVNLGLKYIKDNTSSALDIGCAVGRASYELAVHFNNVTGLDFSANFIKSAILLQDNDELTYKIKAEGDLLEIKTISLKNFKLNKNKNNVKFFQADACNMKKIFTGYDFVLASNLLDRLYDPKKFLLDLSLRMNDNGILVIATPCSWSEEYTAKKNWLGGYVENGKNITTFDGLFNILNVDFDLLEGPIDIPFVIPETKRKFQHTFSQTSVWKKRLCLTK